MSTTTSEHGTQFGEPDTREVPLSNWDIVLNKNIEFDSNMLQSQPTEPLHPAPLQASLPTGHVAARGQWAYALPEPIEIRYHFETLQQWEGTVLGISSDGVLARLRSLGAEMPDKRATISREEISDSDQDLIAPGAVFYWTIGYRIELHGQKSLTSVIKFRRLPSWTKRELERVDEIASDLESLFG